MKEDELYHQLIERRETLAREIQSLTEQLAACDAMLATLKPSPRRTPADARAATVAAPPATIVPPVPEAPLATPPSKITPVPAAPAVPPASIRKPLFDPTAEELAEIAALADSTRRGRKMARVELAIAQCGDTFSLTEILEVFKKQFGWRGSPDQRAIALALWKVVQRRGYRVVRQGSGRTLSVYSKY